MNGLAEQKAQAKTHVEALERDIGAEILDKGKTPGRLLDELAGTENEIRAIEAAESEAARRDRMRAAQELAERRTALRKELGEHDAARLKAIAQAEQAARDFAQSASKAKAAMAEVERIATTLGGRRPNGLSARDQERRLGARLSLVLGKVSSRDHLGGITLDPPPGGESDGDWCAADKRECNLQQFQTEK